MLRNSKALFGFFLGKPSGIKLRMNGTSGTSHEIISGKIQEKRTDSCLTLKKVKPSARKIVIVFLIEFFRCTPLFRFAFNFNL